MKREWTWIWATGVLVAAVGFSSPLSTSLSAPRTAHAASGTECAVERWDVKILSDPAASQVSMVPIKTTVEALRALNIPGRIGLHTPRFPEEMKTYVLTGRLLEAARETDRDYHLVISGARPSATMIAEIPDPACLARTRNRAVVTAITKARNYFDRTFGPPSNAPAFTQIAGTPMVTITGVLFFDRLHNQKGVAPNAVELHPVLDLHSP
jgi:hypothetical protein